MKPKRKRQDYPKEFRDVAVKLVIDNQIKINPILTLSQHLS
jgi:transposase-like protein